MLIYAKTANQVVKKEALPPDLAWYHHHHQPAIAFSTHFYATSWFCHPHTAEMMRQLLAHGGGLVLGWACRPPGT